MSGALQLGFSDYEQVDGKKRTRRLIVLDEMEATIPWDDFHTDQSGLPPAATKG